MTPYTTPITANGIYTFPISSASRNPVRFKDHPATRANGENKFYAAGSFEERTVTFGYVDALGAFAPFRGESGDPLTATSSDGIKCPSPPSGLLAAEVTGSGAEPEITLSVFR